jgi:hypothetical protein
MLINAHLYHYINKAYSVLDHYNLCPLADEPNVFTITYSWPASSEGLAFNLQACI